MKKTVNPSTVAVSMQTAMNVKKQAKPVAVKMLDGRFGIVYPDEPKPMLKRDLHVVEKTIIHLTNEELVPTGNKIISSSEKFVYVPTMTVVRTPRVKLPKGPRVAGPKDFSLYEFDGATYTKGRLVLAVITKYAAENKLSDLKKTFPKFYADVKTIEPKKAIRYFKETFSIEGTEVAVTNQVTATLVDEFISIVGKIYTITKK